jgi:hypothetical protein
MLQRIHQRRLNSIAYQRIREWFLSYVDNFFASDDNCRYHIELKRNHSLRVSSLAGVIGKRIYLEAEDIALAKIIGLLHDVGRFEQFTRHNTFKDNLSFDHGQFGADLLAGIQCILHLDADSQHIVHSAVQHHNKARIPSDLDQRPLLHTKIIRDADKLDILHLTTQALKNHTSAAPARKIEPHDEVSETVLSAFNNRQIIPYDAVRNHVDFYIHKIGWVYDFNFSPSLHILRSRDYFSEIRRALPNTQAIDTIFKQIDLDMSASANLPPLSG